MALDMKSHYGILAKYNRFANEALFGILKDIPEEELSKERGSYFHSIHGVLSHTLSADINWLRRFRTMFGEVNALTHPRLAPEGAAWTDFQFSSFEDLARDRIVVDELYADFVEGAAPAKLDSVLRYIDSHGNPRAFACGSLVDHVFNH